jgi:hypothetical protein
MLVEPSILTAVPAGTEAGRAKEGAATGGAGRLAGAFGRGEAPPAGVGGGVLLASWDAGLLRKKNQPPPASKRNNRIKTMGGGPLLAIKFSLAGKFFVVGVV